MNNLNGREKSERGRGGGERVEASQHERDKQQSRGPGVDEREPRRRDMRNRGDGMGGVGDGIMGKINIHAGADKAYEYAK